MRPTLWACTLLVLSACLGPAVGQTASASGSGRLTVPQAPAAKPGKVARTERPANLQAPNAGTRPSASQAARSRAPAPQDDQSYLFTHGPVEPGGPPSYVTSGSRPFNQPWYMSIYDTTGGW